MDHAIHSRRTKRAQCIEALHCFQELSIVSYLLAAAIKQANSTEGPKILEALQNLKTPVDGVVMTYKQEGKRIDIDAWTFRYA